MELSLKQLERLLKIFRSASVSEFEYKDEKYSFRLAFGQQAASGSAGAGTASFPPSSSAVPGASVVPVDAEDDSFGYITSPFVGTFYTAPSPEAEPFVALGQGVSKGQTLCIVEAMKLMNEIESEFAGAVADVLVDNGASVEYGQRLFKIKKA